jgi:muramidase (phage lysozyme)
MARTVNNNVDKNINAFLYLIAKSEGANYNTLFGGNTFSDYSKHPNVCVNYKTTCSTAAGRYQIRKLTYDDIKGVAGVTDFTPDSQDKCAVALIKRRGAYLDILNGDITNAIIKCGNEWASFGYNGYNQPTHQLDKLKAWYTEGLGITNASVKKKTIS